MTRISRGHRARFVGPTLASIVALASTAASARAQDVGQEPGADDDAEGDTDPTLGASPTADAAEQAAIEAEPVTRWGVGPRLRYVFEPKGMIELFFEEVPSGMAHPGFGLEVVRRRDDLEIAFGLEYENLSPDDGFYREKGAGDVSAKTDYTVFDGFGWITADVTFIFHRPLTELVALRYGAGGGLGFVRGEVLQTDSVGCQEDDLQETCQANFSGAQVNDPADLPPVFPVVTLLAGAQFRPTPEISINLEAGLRTVFFAGISGNYFF